MASWVLQKENGYFCVVVRYDGERRLLLSVTLTAAAEDPFSFTGHLSLLETEEEELRKAFFIVRGFSNCTPGHSYNEIPFPGH